MAFQIRRADSSSAISSPQNSVEPHEVVQPLKLGPLKRVLAPRLCERPRHICATHFGPHAGCDHDLQSLHSLESCRADCGFRGLIAATAGARAEDHSPVINVPSRDAEMAAAIAKARASLSAFWASYDAPKPSEGGHSPRCVSRTLTMAASISG